MFQRELKKTDVLVAYLDEDKILRFLHREGLYSFSFSYDPRFLYKEQLKTAVRKALSPYLSSSSEIELYSAFKEKPLTGDASKGSLSFVRVDFEQQPQAPWEGLSFRDLLDRVESKPARLSLLKIFQLLSDDKTHLIEARVTNEK